MSGIPSIQRKFHFYWNIRYHLPIPILIHITSFIRLPAPRAFFADMVIKDLTDQLKIGDFKRQLKLFLKPLFIKSTKTSDQCIELIMNEFKALNEYNLIRLFNYFTNQNELVFFYVFCCTVM